jgi:predicted nucleic acid-binding protein
MPVFLDTNILLYSISRAPAEAAKRRQALELVDRSDCVISLQTLHEFYHQATRRSKPDAISHEDATSLLTAWLRFEIVENTITVLWIALELAAANNFSIWDNLIIAAAQASGCETLYTEDMQHGRTVAGVRIVNPFR